MLFRVAVNLLCTISLCLTHSVTLHHSSSQSAMSFRESRPPLRRDMEVSEEEEGEYEEEEEEEKVGGWKVQSSVSVG